MMKTLILSIVVTACLCPHRVNASERKEKIDSLNKATYELRNSREWAKMRFFADSALSMSQSLNYKKGEAWAHLNIGIIYYKNHKNDSSLFSLQQATILFEDEKIQFGLALCMSFSGYVYQRLNNYDKAEELFRKEIAIFEQLEDYFELANSLANLGVNYLYQSKYPEALTYSIKALETRKAHMLNPSKEYQNIVFVYHKMKEYDKALNYLKDAIELNIQHQDTAGLIKAYNSIAVNYYGRSTKNYDSTMLYLTKSLDLAKRAKYFKSQIVALGNIAEIYEEQANYLEAKRFIRKALSLQNSLNKRQHLFSVNTLASILFSEGKLDSSLFYSKKVLDGAVKSKDKTLERQSSKFISLIFERNGMYDSALYYYKLSKMANDSIYNTEKAELFSNLQIQLETLEQEKEIEILTQEQIFSRYVNYGLVIIIALILGIAFFIFKTFQERNRRKQSKLEIDKQILEQKIEHNKKELFNFTLNMINKNNSLMDVEEEVKNALSKGKSEVNPSRILSKISIGKSSEKDWVNFNKYFGAVHVDFFAKIKLNYPALTSYELRLCALLKLHLTNREIAEILSIEQKSVKMACYRLKKKFELEESQKLSDFIVML